MHVKNLKNLALAFAFTLFLVSGNGFHAFADDAADDDRIHYGAFRSTTFPLPRFVSLDQGEVYVRAGPGQKYPIKWVFRREGLPVEVILEYENWRKVRDHENQEGWVYHTLLSGKRTGIVLANGEVPVYQQPFEDNEKKSIVNIMIEPFVVVDIESCEGNWCDILVTGYGGWVERKYLWGIYEDENFD